MPQLEITEIVLVHCNITSNDYQQNVYIYIQNVYIYINIFIKIYVDICVCMHVLYLHLFIANKLCRQLLDIIRKNFIFSKTFNSEISYIEV